jgi:hypothetical protein
MCLENVIASPALSIVAGARVARVEDKQGVRGRIHFNLEVYIDRIATYDPCSCLMEGLPCKSIVCICTVCMQAKNGTRYGKPMWCNWMLNTLHMENTWLLQMLYLLL